MAVKKLNIMITLACIIALISMAVVLLVIYAELRTNQDEYLEKISQLQAEIQDIIIEQNKTMQANSEKITSTNVHSTEDKNSDPGANYQTITEKFSALEAKYQAITNQVSVLNQTTEQKISALKTKDQETEQKISALDQATEQKISALKTKDQETEQNISALKTKDQETEQKISALNTKDQETEQKISALKTKDQETEQKISDLEQETEGKISTIEAKQQQMQQVLRPGDCEDLYAGGKTNDGVYTIYPDNSPMQVYCEMSQTQGSIVIQKRYDGSLDYARMFQEYSDGFGDLTAEHWLGLSLMNRITATGRWKLRIELGSFDNEARYAEYSEFKIGPAPGFQLLFDKSSYKGDLGDSLGYHHNMRFSSRDKDQDGHSGSCSAYRGGNSGWWFNNCFYAITTGMPYRTSYSIGWNGWKYGLKSATLKIKKF